MLFLWVGICFYRMNVGRTDVCIFIVKFHVMKLTIGPDFSNNHQKMICKSTLFFSDLPTNFSLFVAYSH